MSHICALIFFASLLHITSAEAEDGCYPITQQDLEDPKAPTFEQYNVKPTAIHRLAHLDIKSNPLAKKYKTVLTQGAAKGPNFAGHYTVVGWGCGISCVTFAVVDALTGKVITPTGFHTISGTRLEADDFQPTKESDYWGLRFKLNSRILIAVGSLDEDDHREGAFYFVFENHTLRPLHSVVVNERWCGAQ